ncbi:hypothetical protein NDU88_003002 [Pleurodeles waltl]|uniref:Uncharacterized protein n=1 Tax=Pleurodeles waltl TaxID=8319 RepID=A0AAV7WSB2_PLEWA|nr:hypothetical protein NDU88_003002 [Pleurodeles waltl]
MERVPSSASEGSRAAATAMPIVRSPGGVPAADSPPGSPGGPPSLRCRSAGSPVARGHQVLPPEKEASSSLVGVFPGCSGLYFLSGWLCVRIQLRAQRVALPGIAASIRRRGRGSKSAPGCPSPPEADTGAAATPKRSCPLLPLAASTSTWGAAPSGVLGPRSTTGPRALASSGQPDSPRSLHQGRDRTPQPLPHAPVISHCFRCRTARSSASRLRVNVGPSGAEQLSLRHAQLRGHAPQNGLLL